MNPFEILIRDLGSAMGLDLNADNHLSCRIFFSEEDPTIQIDLDTNADRILIGSELGPLTAGIYRERIFTQALMANGTAQSPRGILAFSERNDTLFLFQFLKMESLTGEKLYRFLQQFLEHARVWKTAVARGDIPQIEEAAHKSSGSGMFGLKS